MDGYGWPGQKKFVGAIFFVEGAGERVVGGQAFSSFRENPPCEEFKLRLPPLVSLTSLL